MKRHAALVPLSRQHHDGLALGVFIERDLRDGSETSVLEHLRSQALDLWDVEIRGHFAVEESELFRPLRDRLPDPEVVDRLVAEHHQLEEDFEGLRSAPAEGLEARLRTLRERLIRHIRSEERVLFQMAQEVLSEEELAAIGLGIEERLPASCVRLVSARG